MVNGGLTLHWLESHFSEYNFVVMSAQVIGISVESSSYQLVHFIRIPSANPMSPEIHLWTAVQQWQRMGNHTKVGEIAIWQRFSKGISGRKRLMATVPFFQAGLLYFCIFGELPYIPGVCKRESYVIIISRRLFVNFQFLSLNDWLQFYP